MRALVVQGGGTRAAYASGVLAAFEEAGHQPFDALYGTSAGGMLATWYAVGQAGDAARSWWFVEDRRFLSWWRLVLPFTGPFFDQERLFRDVYDTPDGLDADAVARSARPVWLTVTDAATGEPRYVDVRHGPVMQWLRATSRLPIASGPPVRIDGRVYLDGGLTDPVPIQRAIKDGATHVTVVLNRHRRVRKPESRFVVWLVTRRYPALKDRFARHHRHHNKALTVIENPPDGVRVDVVRPKRPHGVGRLTRDVARLEALVDVGRADGHAYVATEPS